MSQRRFHKKSRYGCSQCKNNRTKCDENRPYCGRCKRAGLPCSLVDPTSDLIFIPTESPNTRKGKVNTESPGCNFTPPNANELRDDSPKDSLSTEISVTSTPLSLLQPQITDLELERMRLLNHYTLYTAPTITALTIPSDDSHSIWREWITTLALTPGNAFLLNGLLSLSALHLSLLGHSPQQNILLAIHYHNLGISLFRPQLISITTENYDPIFAFSCITAFYSFGIHRSALSASDAGSNPISQLREVLMLIRGSSVMVKSSHGMLEQSRWSVMIPLDPFPVVDSLPEEMENMLSALHSRVSKLNSPSEHSTEEEIYTQTIHILRSSLSIALNSPHKQMSITFFPNISPTAFWSGGTAGEGLTKELLGLAILANYAVNLHWLRESIWMEGWGRETVEAVRDMLPKDWQDYVAWAVREIESGVEN